MSEHLETKALPDCLSLHNCTDISQVRAATQSRRRAAKDEVLRLVSERLGATIVEIRLDVLCELLDLATDGEALRERRAQYRAKWKQRSFDRRERSSTTWSPEIQSLAAEGLSGSEIVARLGLPKSMSGPIAAQITAARKRGELA